MSGAGYQHTGTSSARGPDPVRYGVNVQKDTAGLHWWEIEVRDGWGIWHVWKSGGFGVSSDVGYLLELARAAARYYGLAVDRERVYNRPRE